MSVDVNRARLDSIELPPFRAAVEEGVGGVMSAHIALPQIVPDKLPATLSKKMLTDVLRGANTTAEFARSNTAIRATMMAL